MRVTRREFNRTMGWASIAVATSRHGVLGANEEVRVAVIGTGGRGGRHIKVFSKLKGARLVALCDVDSDHLAKRMKSLEKMENPPKVEGFTDFRKLLERDDIDAVVIATPNHWHSLLTIYACQAGKHVYVEKPVCHTIWEGKQMVAAARKYDRIVQAGSQNRSDIGLRKFMARLHAGDFGRILKIRGLCYRKRTGIGKRDTPLTPPETVDYNLWLGPAADLPIYRPRFHYDWHWVWNTGNGDIGNQGPHETNLICWALQDPGAPVQVSTFGGRFGWHDAGETPNMQFAAYELAGVPVLFEVRDLRLKPDDKKGPSYKGKTVGIIVTCEGGEFRGGRGGGWLYDDKGEKVEEFKGDGGRTHQANFIAAVDSGKTEDLHAPVHENFPSSCLAHLANISHRAGASISPGELRERLSGNADGLDALQRFTEQLANWNIDYAQEPFTVGATLEWDHANLRFSGALADKANQLVRRRDRSPFIVPELA